MSTDSSSSAPPPPYRAQDPEVGAKPANPPNAPTDGGGRESQGDRVLRATHTYYTRYSYHGSRTSEAHPLLGNRRRRRRRPNPAHALMILLLFAVATLLYLNHMHLYHKVPTAGQPDDDREEDRKHRSRMNLYWDTPSPAFRCSRYATRMYSARLWNVEIGYDWMKACQNTPVAIHGRMIAHPDSCEDHGFIGGAIGFWNVTFGEPTCEPGWGVFFDKGCAGRWSGHRLIESRLYGLREGEDWQNMCMTAPATVRGIPFEHPEYCVRKGNVMHGYWKVPDLACLINA